MIERAVEILRRGGLVAFPTETVYGLGADARNPDAVAKIFAAKGRPATNPLIVHVHSVEAAKRYASEWPSIADKLAATFWPGPLTMVVRKAGSIVDIATAGGPTVGLRVPNHPVALELLRAFDGPIAAPSANRSNHISPTTAEHVRQELGASVDLILHGGTCQVGIESTVLSITDSTPRLLRPGGVSLEQLEATIGPVEFQRAELTQMQTAASPGQLKVHYAPRTPTFWILADEAFPDDESSVQIAFGDSRPWRRRQRIDMPGDAESYARNLYESLRQADAAGASRIIVQMPPDSSEWAAVRDRLLRAAKPLKNFS